MATSLSRIFSHTASKSHAAASLIKGAMTPEDAGRFLIGKGVTKDEMRWMGIDAYLAKVKAEGGRVTQEALLSTIRENDPEIEEKLHGPPLPTAAAPPKAKKKDAPVDPKIARAIAHYERMKAAADAERAAATAEYNRHSDHKSKIERQKQESSAKHFHDLGMKGTLFALPSHPYRRNWAADNFLTGEEAQAEVKRRLLERFAKPMPGQHHAFENLKRDYEAHEAQRGTVEGSRYRPAYKDEPWSPYLDNRGLTSQTYNGDSLPLSELAGLFGNNQTPEEAQAEVQAIAEKHRDENWPGMTEAKEAYEAASQKLGAMGTRTQILNDRRLPPTEKQLAAAQAKYDAARAAHDSHERPTGRSFDSLFSDYSLQQMRKGRDHYTFKTPLEDIARGYLREHGHPLRHGGTPELSVGSKGRYSQGAFGRGYHHSLGVTEGYKNGKKHVFIWNPKESTSKPHAEIPVQEGIRYVSSFDPEAPPVTQAMLNKAHRERIRYEQEKSRLESAHDAAREELAKVRAGAPVPYPNGLLTLKAPKEKKEKVGTPVKYPTPAYWLPGATQKREHIFHFKTLPAGDGGVPSIRQSHWGDVPTAYAHARTAVHSAPGGGSRFVVDEVQSDWFQKHRELEAAQKKQAAISKKANAPDASDDERAEAIRQHREQQQKIDSLSRTFPGGKLPEVPFANTWHEQVLRRLLHHAAEAGHKEFAIAAGRPNAERGNHYTYFHKFEWTPHPQDPSKILLTVHERGKGGGRMVGEKPGASPTDGIPWANLHSVVESEQLAQRMRDAHEVGVGGKLVGTELSIPKEGVMRFYNDTYPNYVERFAKRFDPEAKMVKADLDDEKGAHVMKITDKLRQHILKEPLAKFQRKEGGAFQVPLDRLMLDRDNAKLAIHELHRGHVPDLMAPIEVVKHGDEYHVVDGHHRSIHAYGIGKTHLPDIVKPGTPHPDPVDIEDLSNTMENGYLLKRIYGKPFSA
jgi:hypothetical protein